VSDLVLSTEHPAPVAERPASGAPPRRIPAAVPWLVAAALFVLFALTANQFVLLVAGTVLIYAMSAVGLNLLMGQAGLLSLGNAALMAVGAYLTAVLSPLPGWGAFPVPLLASAVVGAAVGALITLPAIRLRGVYLALATLALQFFVAFAGDQYQEGVKAVSGLQVEPLTIAGYEFELGAPMILLLGAFLGLTIAVVRGLTRQAQGRMWAAIRESELAAAALGVGGMRWKLAAFVVSSTIIALSGSLLAYYNLLVSSESFSLDFAISFIVMLIIGGMGTITGAVVGALIVVSLPFVLSTVATALPQEGFGEWLGDNIFYINNGLYGVLVLGFLLYRPEGIVPAVRGTIERRRRPVSEPRAVEAGVRAPEADVALLEVRDLAVTYQTGARAVDGMNLRVREGALVAVLGRNGAGKTSSLRAISGFCAAEQVTQEGRVRLGGRDITRLSPAATASLGVVLVPERDKVFPSLTVGEHLSLASPRDWQEVLDRPYFARLAERLDQPAGLLSGGERQLLALSVAALLRPRVLLVDEFSLGLAPAMTQQVSEVIRELRDEQGMSVLIVEQNAAAALALADWVYLAEGGRIVAEGPPDAMADHDLLLGVPTHA
jgi:branched-chain amino acid transport system permease protein